MAKNIAMANAGVSATGSNYGLIRLQADVIALNPELVIIDFAVNDWDETWSRATGEAMVRRLRTSLPNAKLVAALFLQVADQAGVDTTNVKEPVHAAWIAICNQYGIPYADFAAEVQRAVAAEEHPISYYLGDVVHPTAAGHLVAAELLRPVIPTLFAGPQVSGALPERIYDNGDYENDPILRTALDNDGQTAGWATVNDTQLISTTANDTLTYIGTFQMIIRNIKIGAGQGVIGTVVDGGAETTVDMSADASNYRTHWVGTRAEHTVVFRVVSGSITFRNFYAI